MSTLTHKLTEPTNESSNADKRKFQKKKKQTHKHFNTNIITLDYKKIKLYNVVPYSDRIKNSVTIPDLQHFISFRAQDTTSILNAINNITLHFLFKTLIVHLDTVRA